MRKMLLFVASVILLPITAHAQEQVYTLTVTHAQLSVIGSALSERPYKDVNPVIESIARQVRAQNAAEEKKRRDEQSKIDELKKQAAEKANAPLTAPAEKPGATDSPAPEGSKP